MPDIVIAGATYPDVPQIDVPKVGGGTASFYANGAGTLITKTITENGTYSAEDDDADGYSEVTVNVSGGGSHVRQAFYMKFFPATVLTRANPMSVQLEASSNCFILVRAVSYPTAPATGYKALVWGRNLSYFTPTYINAGVIHSILRANGTIGTDDTQCAYNSTTGVLSVGGAYGYFNPEDEYEIIQVVFE